MELYSLHGLRAEPFTSLVFMASDEKIANAVREWCANHENTGNWIVDDPATLIDLACIKAEIPMEYNDLQLIVQRVEVLASARGVLLPKFWQVIY